jgi:hypothetical protein
MSAFGGKADMPYKPVWGELQRDARFIANAREQARQKAEDERKERHLKQIIEGICKGC